MTTNTNKGGFGSMNEQKKGEMESGKTGNKSGNLGGQNRENAPEVGRATAHGESERGQSQQGKNPFSPDRKEESETRREESYREEDVSKDGGQNR